MAAKLPRKWAAMGNLVGEYASLCGPDGPPDLSAFLERHRQATPAQRAGVVLFDQFHRWRNGEMVPAESYFEQFPELTADRAVRLEIIVEEIGYRRERGESLDVTEYLNRFPELADDLVAALAQPSSETPADDDPATTASYTIATEFRAVVGELPTDTPQPTGEGEQTRVSRQQFSLPPLVLERIRQHMTERSFAAGELLMRQGDPGDSLLVVTAGEVEVATTDETGRRHLITRSPGAQVLGEMALLTDQPRSADVLALTPVEALVLPADRFHELAARYPVISQVLTQVIARRLGQPGRDDVLWGKTFDGYRIIGRLGRGGMAVVYEAEELATGRHVALKMMSHRLVYEPGAREQFQREADIIQSFDHPNIVRVHGRFAAFHTYFIVMDFCDGPTLDQVVRRCGPLPEATVRPLVGQIAAALDFAHAAGIVHRDVKPSNIILTHDGKALLMDFGLARPVAQPDAMDDHLIVGTPRYMAPEQVLGGPIGKAADVFALGCVIFELLAGRPLIAGGRVSRVLRSHSRWRTPDLDQRLPHVAPELRAILTACLRPNPAARQVDLGVLAAWAAPVTLPPARDTAKRRPKG